MSQHFKLNLIEKIEYFFTFYVYNQIKRKYQGHIYTYYAYRKCRKVGANLKVNGKIQGVGRNVDIGDNCNFNPGTLILGNGEVTIGDYFHCGNQLTIITQNHNFDTGDAIPYSGYIIKSVIIKNFVWCGHNVTILPGVTIGEGAIVAACSVVTKDIPDYAIFGGNPARFIKTRDINHFKEMQVQGKFH